MHAPYRMNKYTTIKVMKGVGLFRQERHVDILRILYTRGRVEVDTLAEKYQVSVDSIRKDLQHLAHMGLCKRVYGGALISEDTERVTSYLAEHHISNLEPIPSLTEALPLEPQDAHEDTDDECVEDDQTEGIRAVARRAYFEINDGDSVFLDLSRTNIEIATLLAQGNKRAIVTTNMLDVLKILANAPHITTLATGGFLNIALNGFVGSETISLLEPLLFAKAFIGAGAINLETMAVTAGDIDSGSVKEKVIHNASYTFLLANKEKFTRKMSYRFASITDFSAVITDCKDADVLMRLQQTGTPVLRA